MSGSGSIRVETPEDQVREDKIIEDNAALKDLVIEMRVLIEYLKAIFGEKL